MLKKYFKNNSKIFQDASAKSLSFFYRSKNPVLSKEILKELKNIAFETKQELRLNLHENSNSPIHNMIIFQWNTKYVRPHKHSYKTETCHLIEGEQLFATFDNNGNIDNKFLMNSNNFIFKTSIDQYHTTVPLSEYVIFHEIKVGPFLKENDSIFLDNTDFQTKEEIDFFKEKLLEYKL